AAHGVGVDVLAGGQQRCLNGEPVGTGDRGAGSGVAGDGAVDLGRQCLGERGGVGGVAVGTAGGLGDAGQLVPRRGVDLEPDGVDDQIDAPLVPLIRDI